MDRAGTGVAFDLGSTTIAAAAMEMGSGRVLGTAFAPNPQARWGSDILARVEAVIKEPALIGELQAATAGACNALMLSLAGGRPVAAVTAAGNPVMEHILLGVSPATLGRVPYRPAFKEARIVEARSIGLDAEPGAPLYVFPMIGGFVGGDAVAVALGLGLGGKDRALAIDVGTNSEILLSSNGVVYATSAAAGPAFEAGGISRGMTAGRGAVRGAAMEQGRLRLDVIGNVTPRGICGSGLVDAAACLIEAGVIDPTGRIRNPGEVESNFASGIAARADGNSFILFRGPSASIEITQADIRSLQTAKAAIRAGAEMLLEKAGLDASDIREVFIAGAFGASLKTASLERIGLIDASWAAKVRPVGDAALDGAVAALNSDEARSEAERIAREARLVPLSGSAHFEREFLGRMGF